MERIVLWHRVVPAAREEDDRPADVRQWTRRVVTGMRAAGGDVLGNLGSTVAASFDLPDLSDAMDLALELLDEAQAREPPLRIALGAALGELDAPAGPAAEPSGWLGAAIDRAQLLANRARVGELVLDPAARDAASSLYLFGRQVGTRATALRGQAVDRSQPRREACRRFVRHLRPAPVPPTAEEQLAPMRELAHSGAADRVVLRGPPGAGAKAWIAALEREVVPPLVLRVSGVPAALEPLGSLRRALCRRWGAPDRVGAAVDSMGIPRKSCEQITRLAAGEPLPRAEAVDALRELLAGVALGGERPWIVLDPVSNIDPATFEVIGEAIAGDGSPATLLVARLGLEAQVPEALTRDRPPREFVLPALRGPDARAIAEVVLGDEPGSEVARRVAVLGGETPLGVEEAARTLVASGDLVYVGERFVWRVGPRSGVRAIPTEALVDERVAALEQAPHQLLEAACVMPLGTDPAAVVQVARADGLSERACQSALESLRLESFLTEGPGIHPTSETLRQVVLQSMPPARNAELHRFVAEALRDQPHGAFASATIGYCLAEGGQSREGARALIEAARAAVDAGFARSAIRVAAAAVQFDPSAETRVAASAVSRSMSSRPPPAIRGGGEEGSTAAAVVALQEEDALPDLVQRTVRSMLERDFDAAERFIDMAIAEGCDRPAADRLRAIAHLARGDHPAAMQALARTHEGEEGDRRRATRAALTRALVLMHGGEPASAVRPSLRALGFARALRDPRGEAAALHILAACYRTLGRPQDAEAIEDASPA
ncbi:MAG: hypothetical protein ACOCV4_03870 [Myxococcota bacterium]